MTRAGPSHIPRNFFLPVLTSPFSFADSQRHRVPDADAGSLPDLPVGGLRPQPGDQVQPARRERRDAGGDRLLAHLRRGLHGRHGHRDPDEGLRQEGPAALLLQPEAVGVRRLRGRRAHGLRRLLQSGDVGRSTEAEGLHEVDRTENLTERWKSFPTGGRCIRAFS